MRYSFPIVKHFLVFIEIFISHQMIKILACFEIFLLNIDILGMRFTRNEIGEI